MKRRELRWSTGITSSLVIAVGLVGIDAGLAQIVPDDTLGEERSRLTVITIKTC